MTPEQHLWDLVGEGDYIADKTGDAWKVLQVNRHYGRPRTMAIVNRRGQHSVIDVPQDAFATVTKLVPTHEEALTTLRGVFPEAEEISHG